MVIWNRAEGRLTQEMACEDKTNRGRIGQRHYGRVVRRRLLKEAQLFHSLAE